jgi:hypothetical protein
MYNAQHVTKRLRILEQQRHNVKTLPELFNDKEVKN